MLIDEVMSRPVWTIRMRASVSEAAAVLVERGFTALPVIDDAGHLVGIVTEADLLRERSTADHATAHPDVPGPMTSPTVSDVMSTPVLTLTPQSDVDDAARLMVDKRLRAVPVVEGSTVVGIVTRRDVLRPVVPQQHVSTATSGRRPPPLAFDFDR